MIFGGSRKLNQLIDFPMTSLNMTPYLVEVQNEVDAGGEPRQFIYDLYAVSNHYGSMNGGHYTAFCVNPIYNRWFVYDDESVRFISKNEDPAMIQQMVVSKAAYVLFYKLRK